MVLTKPLNLESKDTSTLSEGANPKVVWTFYHQSESKSRLGAGSKWIQKVGVLLMSLKLHNSLLEATVFMDDGDGGEAIEGMYVLSNVASGNEFHKEAVMQQLFPQMGNDTQSIMIKLLQSNDGQLRMAAVWVVVNLTFPSSPGAYDRVVKLRNGGVISQLKNMVNDPCLDVKLDMIVFSHSLKSEPIQEILMPIGAWAFPQFVRHHFHLHWRPLTRYASVKRIALSLSHSKHSWELAYLVGTTDQATKLAEAFSSGT
ncbi:hypothetical protein ACSBR2_033406 [Camellia fascicularis]